MLVIRCRPNEPIRIGPEITVRVTSVRGKLVRIGIDAPPEFKILRHALQQRGAAVEGQRQWYEKTPPTETVEAPAGG